MLFLPLAEVGQQIIILKVKQFSQVFTQHYSLTLYGNNLQTHIMTASFITFKNKREKVSKKYIYIQ